MRTYGEPIDVRTAATQAESEPGAGAGAVAVLRAEAAALREDPAVAVALEQAQAPAPAQFLWRGRLYVVRAVLAHWVELGTWWTAGTRAARPAPAPEPGPDGRRSVASDVGVVEREVWRVEARAGRSASVGVYDLVRDVPSRPAPGAARWRLARALD